MAAKRKAAKGKGKQAAAGKRPKFGSPAWFAKYPKAAGTAKAKGKKTAPKKRAKAKRRG